MLDRARILMQVRPARLAPRCLCAAVALFMVPLAGAEAPATASDACRANLDCNQAAKVARPPERAKPPRLDQWARLAVSQPVSTAPVGGAAPKIDDPLLGSTLVLVPGGCYSLPRDSSQESASPSPAELCVQPFYIGALEVTFEAFDQFAEATGRKLPDDEGWGRGQRPVVNVNVYDAMAFAKWLSRKHRVRYRLPTEVEWEHAARAGSDTRYPWGDELGVGRANCDGCGSRWDDEQTAPVGSFAPNRWGLYDMIGNVAEWTCSMRDPDPTVSFTGCDSIYETRRRAYRNGAWSDPPELLEPGSRDWNAAMRRTDDVGFRLVRECPECARLTLDSPARLVLEEVR